MSNKIDLETFAGGALSERFNMAYQEVLENIMDPNTEFKIKRKVTLELSFKATEDRELSVIDISTKTKLAPNAPTSTKILIDRDGNGNVVASEYDKQYAGQQYMKVDEETGELLTNDSSQTIDTEGIKLVR